MIAASRVTLHKGILNIGIVRPLQIYSELIGFNYFVKTRLFSKW